MDKRLRPVQLDLADDDTVIRLTVLPADLSPGADEARLLANLLEAELCARLKGTNE